MRAVDFLKNKWVAVPAVALLILSLGFLSQNYITGSFVSGDQIEYTSNSEFFDGEVFVINYIGDRTTDKIHAEIPASQLSSAADGDVTKDLTIDITSQETYARYSTTSTSLSRIYAFKAINSEVFTDTSSSEVESRKQSWAEQNCFDIDGDSEIEQGDDYTERFWVDGAIADYYNSQVYCVRENGYYGNIAELSSPDKEFEAEVEVKADGEPTQSTTLSNSDLGQGRCDNIGEYVRACWTGLNPTGEGVPEPYNVYAIHSNTFTPEWRVISAERYSSYNSYVENNLYSQIEAWKEGSLSQEEVVSTANDQAAQAAQRVSSGSFTDYQVEDSSYENGQIRLNPSYDIAWPEFTFYVDGADYISVEKPVGEPRIVNVEGDEFGEMQSGTVTAEVENTASYEGSFSARVSKCSDGFGYDSLQQTKSVDPGETVSFDFRVSFTSDSFDQKTVSGSCEIVVSDTGDSSNTDAAVVDVEATQSNECTPNEEFVRTVNSTHSRILECSSDGLSTTEVDVCGDGEEAAFRNGSWTCVSDGTLPGGGDGSGGSGGGEDTDDCVVFTVGDLEIEDPFCADGPLEMLSKMFHLVAGTAVAFFTGSLGYRAGRWVDGEYQIKGGFDPLKSRSVSRAKRGRFVIGLIAGAVSFLFGFYVILLVPIWAQLMVILGYALFKIYTPY